MSITIDELRRRIERAHDAERRVRRAIASCVLGDEGAPVLRQLRAERDEIEANLTDLYSAIGELESAALADRFLTRAP